ncbi:MAG: DUF1273 domain-containing protein [Lachnospiraceae bacterium]|nr:DUF1273 domain-containing protein [Ruminococcus sp.]MCM1276165.1 DUF1273 domain-containing protein [Lachnospiraceae bacterium]
MYRISFTGYRPEKLPFFGEDDPMCVDLKQRLSEQIEKLINDGANEFYTGMALGVDTWAAEAVLAHKKAAPAVKLIAVLPCPEQFVRWSAEDKARYRSVLGQCDKILTISPHYVRDCMLKRNRALVELCDVLVAVYDGKKGGTEYTVNFAKSRGKRVVLIPPM